MRGTAHLFGDNVNTDLITPSEYNGRPIDVMAEHVFEPIDPAFADAVADGDVVVAGDRFGAGSGRESAPRAILEAGVGAVVADSFARIFYRNAIAVGLPIATCPGIVDRVSDGDTLDVDFAAGTIENLSTDERYSFEPPSKDVRHIIEAGGLVEYYRRNATENE